MNQDFIEVYPDLITEDTCNTIIKGIENGSDMHSICKEFKKKLGVGGSVKNKDIYLQGNHRQRLQKILSERGFKIKLSGG